MTPDHIREAAIAAVAVLIIGGVFLFTRLIDWLFEPADVDKHADWKGANQRRFVLRRFCFEWGRWCFKTDCAGMPAIVWWEREPEP